MLTHSAMELNSRMTISSQTKLSFKDVLIKPRPTSLRSRSQVNLEVSYVTKHSNRVISGFPVIVSNMDTTGQISVAKALYPHSTFVALHKYISSSEYTKFFTTGEYSKYTFYTMGMSDDDFIRCTQLGTHLKNLGVKMPMIHLDVANGYMYDFLNRIKKVRDKFPDTIILAGSVATPEGVENIIKAGADIVKCGIANGGFCDTSHKAGVGYPQLSVAIECGQAANELQALCCSDGGCKTPADFCKALAAGSHFVMAGSVFAGHDENTGEWELDNEGNRVRMKMYGMSSKFANEKYNGGLQNYRTSEGKEGWVNYKGPIQNTILDIKGGLASCCTYTNTLHLENLYKNAEFVLV